MTLLIVEDEMALNKSICDYLSAAGYRCEPVYTFEQALEKTDCHEYDCIILDIQLPGGTGLQLLRLWQQDGKRDGVIVISARNGLEDRIEGLQLGADDYLVKPFHLSELSVRIAAIIRRKQFQGQSIVDAGYILIDTLGKTVSIHKKTLDLTQKEYQLLLFLVVNRNRVLSKNAISRHLWGDDMDYPASFDFLYTHIKNLRKKILAAGGSDCIKSVYGAGYKMQL